MKRLTATFADDAQVDLSSLVAKAIDFCIESIEDTKLNGHKPKSEITRFVRSGQTVQSIIMVHHSPQATFSRTDVQRWVEEAGYNPISWHPACSNLVQTGHLEKVNANVFRFIKPFKKGQLMAEK